MFLFTVKLRLTLLRNLLLLALCANGSVIPELVIPREIPLGQSLYIMHNWMIASSNEATLKSHFSVTTKDAKVITVMNATADSVDTKLDPLFTFEQSTPELTRMTVSGDVVSGKYVLNYKVDPASATSKQVSFQVVSYVNAMIECDKPKYKPGNTIRARLLTFGDMNRNPISNTKQKLAVLELESPEKLKIVRLISPLDLGVAQFEVRTGSNLKPGTYIMKMRLYESTNTTITVDDVTYDELISSSPSNWKFLDNVKAQEDIIIENYVLPKYEIGTSYSAKYVVNDYRLKSFYYEPWYPYWNVKVPVDKNGMPITTTTTTSTTTTPAGYATRDFNVTVSGMYTYGKPVVGKINVKLYTVKVQWKWDSNKQESKKMEESTLILSKKHDEIKNHAKNKNSLVSSGGVGGTNDLLDFTSVFVDLNGYDIELAKNVKYWDSIKLRSFVEITDTAMGRVETKSQDFEVYSNDYTVTIETETDKLIHQYESKEEAKGKRRQLDREVDGNESISEWELAESTSEGAPASSKRDLSSMINSAYYGPNGPNIDDNAYVVSSMAPGLPSCGKVVLRRPDGTPYTAEDDVNVPLKVSFSMEGYEISEAAITGRKDQPEREWKDSYLECPDDSTMQWALILFSKNSCIKRLTIKKGQSSTDFCVQIPNDSHPDTSCCDLSRKAKSYIDDAGRKKWKQLVPNRNENYQGWWEATKSSCCVTSLNLRISSSSSGDLVNLDASKYLSSGIVFKIPGKRNDQGLITKVYSNSVCLQREYSPRHGEHLFIQPELSYLTEVEQDSMQFPRIPAMTGVDPSSRLLTIKAKSTNPPEDLDTWTIIITSQNRLIATQTLPPVSSKVEHSLLLPTQKYYTWEWKNVPLARKKSDNTYEDISHEFGTKVEIYIQGKTGTASVSTASVVTTSGTNDTTNDTTTTITNQPAENQTVTTTETVFSTTNPTTTATPSSASAKIFTSSFAMSTELSTLNTVSMSLDYSERRPGERVKISVTNEVMTEKADGSQVIDTYILGIDKSVSLLGGRAAISEELLARTLQNANAIEMGAKTPFIAGRQWKECTDYGIDGKLDPKKDSYLIMPGDATSKGFLGQGFANNFQIANIGLLPNSTDWIDWEYSNLPECPRVLYGSCYSGGNDVMMTRDGGMMVGVAMDDASPVAESTAKESTAITESTSKPSNFKEALSTRGSSNSGPKIRQYFPETWLWRKMRTTLVPSAEVSVMGAPDTLDSTKSNVTFMGTSGSSQLSALLAPTLSGLSRTSSVAGSSVRKDSSTAIIEETCPDTVTSYQLFMFSVTSSYGGLSILKPKMKTDSIIQTYDNELKIFKPAFVEIDFPNRVVRTEIFKTNFTVFNFFESDLEFDLTLTFDSALTLPVTATSDGKSQLEAEGYLKTTETGVVVNDNRVSAPAGVIPEGLSGTFKKTLVHYKKKVTVPKEPGYLKITSLGTIATQIGDANIVQAKIENPIVRNSNTVVLTEKQKVDLQDALQRTIMVKPEGREQSSDSSFVNVLEHTVQKTTEHKVKSEIVTKSDKLVRDSMRIELKITGDVLGPDILSNLGSLVRVPTGCGEQNMIGLTPNVAVALAYQGQGKFLGEVKNRILTNMQIGVQRELMYRHGSKTEKLDYGGYSGFGPHSWDGKATPASTWLTAFVLRIFSDISEFISVDEEILFPAASMLINSQQPDGSFKVRGKLWHDEMVGGASMEGGATKGLTSFILLTFDRFLRKVIVKKYGSGCAADGSVGSTRNQIECAISNIKDSNTNKAAKDIYASFTKGFKHLDTSTAKFTRYDWMLYLRICASNVLYNYDTTLGLSKAKTLGQLSVLKASTVDDNDESVEHDYYPYKDPSGTTTTTPAPGLYSAHCWDCYRTKAIDVEMTAYALQIQTLLGETASSLKTVKYLGSKRKRNGGFVSTQDTIVALESIGMFARQVFSSSNEDVMIDLYHPRETGKVLVKAKISQRIASTSYDMLQSYILYDAVKGADPDNASGSQNQLHTYFTQLLEGSVQDRITSTFVVKVTGITGVCLVTLITSYNVKQDATKGPEALKADVKWQIQQGSATGRRLLGQSDSYQPSQTAHQLASSLAHKRKIRSRSLTNVQYVHDSDSFHHFTTDAADFGANAVGNEPVVHELNPNDAMQNRDRGIRRTLKSIPLARDIVKVCATHNGVPADENMILIKVNLFTGWALDSEDFICPASRCEANADGSLYLYLERLPAAASSSSSGRASGSTTGLAATGTTDAGNINCYEIPVVEVDQVEDRQDTETVISYFYKPEVSGTTTSDWCFGKSNCTSIELVKERKAYQKEIKHNYYLQNYACGEGKKPTTCAYEVEVALNLNQKARKDLAGGFKSAYNIQTDVSVSKIRAKVHGSRQLTDRGRELATTGEDSQGNTKLQENTKLQQNTELQGRQLEVEDIDFGLKARKLAATGVNIDLEADFYVTVSTVVEETEITGALEEKGSDTGLMSTSIKKAFASTGVLTEPASVALTGTTTGTFIEGDSSTVAAEKLIQAYEPPPPPTDASPDIVKQVEEKKNPGSSHNITTTEAPSSTTGNTSDASVFAGKSMTFATLVSLIFAAGL